MGGDQNDDFELDDDKTSGDDLGSFEEIGRLQNWMLKSHDDPIQREMIESQSDDV